ncbi:PAS domain S-box protein [Antricoccus suffuscus]|uniref:PAS domain S-box protein n=1 Tax=Antricoccus suffuscus TaxID=1629062 RepID=UPI001472E488|nr:PAS domain S-box protein [Antricoccus suffuscus]
MSRRLLDLTVDLACVANFDGYFEELSDGWTDLLGYDCKDLLWRPLLDFVQPDDVESTAAQLEAGRNGQDITRFENRFMDRDGATRWLSWTAVAIATTGRYYAVARDLTRQRIAEEDGRESERRYADLIESSHDIIQSISPDGHFQFVNKAWHDHLGYSPEELPGLTLFDIVDEEFHDHCTVIIGQIMSGMTIDSVEVTFVAKDGRKFPVEGNATGRFRDGVFMATHTFFRDITDRKEAEALTAQYQLQLEQDVAERTAALVQSEKLATLGRLSAGMAHELNNPAAAAQRGAVLLRDALSETCNKFFDLAAQGLTGNDAARLAELVEHGTRRATMPDTLDAMSRSDRESDVEDWLDARGVAAPWELAGPIVSLDLDIGDLDKIAGDFAPEKLASALSLMTNSFTAFALLAQIGHGSGQISEIVKALKDYSFMDQAPVQEVDVHEGLDNTLVMLQAKLKRGVAVDRRYGQDIPRIEALGSELNQVWTNLIDNAVDAMGASGHLVISTSADDEWVTVMIEDDGPGIDPSLLDKVFDPFFTTKLPGQGTGLGLNIVFNIVRGSGGRIDVTSDPGRTVFRVRIPLRRDTTGTEVEAQ